MAAATGSILGGVGAVAGALGGNDTEMVPTQITGFDSMPSDIQKYLTDSIFPRITAYGQTPYQTVPLRRINEDDVDPVFGSKSRQWLQQYYDNKRIADMANKSAPQEAAPQKTDANMMKLYAEMAAAASPSNTMGSKTNQIYQRYLDNPEMMQNIAGTIEQYGGQVPLSASTFGGGAGLDYLNMYLAQKKKQPMAENAPKFDYRVMAGGA